MSSRSKWQRKAFFPKKVEGMSDENAGRLAKRAANRYARRRRQDGRTVRIVRKNAITLVLWKAGPPRKRVDRKPAFKMPSKRKQFRSGTWAARSSSEGSSTTSGPDIKE